MPLPSKKTTTGLPGLPDDVVENKKSAGLRKRPLRPSLPTQEFDDAEFTKVNDSDLNKDLDDSSSLFEITQNNTPSKKEEEYHFEEEEREYNIPQPNYKEPLEKKLPEEDKFIDKKNKKIIPTGGDKSKSKAKAKDFDHRRNSLVFLKLIRFFMFIFIIGIFGLGIKNTFFPENIYTNDEIANIATTAIGETGFPMDRGRALAQEFLYYYLNSDTSNTTMQQIVSRFYSGEVVTNGATTPEINKLDKTGTNQKTLTMPILFDELAITETTGMFKFSALVSDTNGEMIGEDGSLKAHWMSFAINIYYNPDNNKLAIHSNSLSIIPTYKIADLTEAPQESALGNGEVLQTVPEKMNSTIDGFIKGYASSNVDDHAEVDQYIPKNPSPELISGFGGQVELSENNSITKKVYLTDDSKVFKVDLTVWFTDKQASSNGNDYAARYVLTVEEIKDGTFIVTKVAPYLYIPEVVTTEE